MVPRWLSSRRPVCVLTARRASVAGQVRDQGYTRTPDAPISRSPAPGMAAASPATCVRTTHACWGEEEAWSRRILIKAQSWKISTRQISIRLPISWLTCYTRWCTMDALIRVLVAFGCDESPPRCNSKFPGFRRNRICRAGCHRGVFNYLEPLGRRGLAAVAGERRDALHRSRPQHFTSRPSITLHCDAPAIATEAENVSSLATTATSLGSRRPERGAGCVALGEVAPSTAQKMRAAQADTRCNRQRTERQPIHPAQHLTSTPRANRPRT